MASRFSAKVYKLGINPCVGVPAQVSQALGKKGTIPVTGSLNGQPFHATLVPKGDGTRRLYVNGEMRRQAAHLHQPRKADH
jgi:hypothetical protein